MLYQTASDFLTLTARVSCSALVTSHSIARIRLTDNLLTMRQVENWDEYTIIDCPHQTID